MTGRRIVGLVLMLAGIFALAVGGVFELCARTAEKLGTCVRPTAALLRVGVPVATLW